MKREELQEKYQKQVEKVEKAVGDNKKLMKEIDKLASLRAQLAIEPMNFYVKEDEVIKVKDMGSTELGLTERFAYFRSKGGFRMFATPNLGLYQLIKGMIEGLDNRDKLDEEGKEALDLNVDAFKFIAMVPSLCASDQNFFYEVAAEAIKYVQTQSEDALNLINPRKEDGAANAAFQNAVEGAEQLADATNVKEQGDGNEQQEGEGKDKGEG